MTNEIGGYTRVIGQVLEFYSFFVFLVITVILTLFLHPLIKTIPQLKPNLSNRLISPKKKAIVILTFITMGYIIAFASPLLFIPANAYHGVLPKKPELIAHRGAAYLGPENTIEVAEVATPITYNRYTLNQGGALVGWASSREQSILKRLGQKTPIKGLYITSAWTYPGGGVNGVTMGGQMCARLIARKHRIKRE